MRSHAKAVLGDVKTETKHNADRLAVPGHWPVPKIEKASPTCAYA
jgi:hypothetical protein